MKKSLLIVLISSILSLAIHAYLASEYYQLKFGASDGQSLCNISDMFNCDKVSLSDYSTLWGVPMAIWGASTHLIFSSILVFILLGWTSELVFRLAGWLSLLIASTSIVMGTISFFLIQSMCPFCMATYVLSFVGAYFFLRDSLTSLFSNLVIDTKNLLSSSKLHLLILLAVPALAFLANSMVSDRYGASEIKWAIQESLKGWRESSPITFQESLGLEYGNTKNPEITIVEFADYLCPHCKYASPTLEAFTQSKGNVKLVFKAFPLDAICNPDLPHRGDGLRCQLAYFSACAQKIHQKGWATHHWIFNKQDQWSVLNFDQQLKSACQELGLNYDEIKNCLQDDSVRESIAKQAKEGVAAQVKGTPSIFMQGKFLEHGQLLMILEAAYQEALH